MEPIYLDNASTSFPKPPQVAQAMFDYVTGCGCNIGRGGYEGAYQAEETVRTLYDISVDRGTDDIITIRLKGSGFLYNMVRAMVGTVVYAAEGKLAPEDIPAILASGNRTLAGPTVPPGGLYMTKLWYDEEVLKVASYEIRIIYLFIIGCLVGGVVK